MARLKDPVEEFHRAGDGKDEAIELLLDSLVRVSGEYEEAMRAAAAVKAERDRIILAAMKDPQIARKRIATAAGMEVISLYKIQDRHK